MDVAKNYSPCCYRNEGLDNHAVPVHFVNQDDTEIRQLLVCEKHHQRLTQTYLVF